MSRRKPGGHPSPERMEKLRAAYKEYTDPEIPEGERLTEEELETKYGIPQSTLDYWFKKFEAEGTVDPDAIQTIREQSEVPGGKGKDRMTLVTDRSVMTEALKKIRERSKADTEKVYVIGALVVERYQDLINIALNRGMKLEDFMVEVFNWYERKEEVEQEVSAKNARISELEELTEPNYRFKRKSQILIEFAQQITTQKQLGMRVNPRDAARALQHDLDKIDEEINMRSKPKTETEPQQETA